MRQKNKLYLYKTWAFFMLMCLIGIFVPIIGIVLLWETILYRVSLIVISCVFLLIFIYFSIIGGFTPIHISDDGIVYRKLSLSWDEIKITAYPQLNKSLRYGYYLIFDRNYIYDLKSIRKKLFNGCRVYMDKKSLDIILSYCKHRVVILDPSATSECLPNSTLQCNALLVEFNKKFESNDRS